MADKIATARAAAFTPTPAQAAAFANPVVIDASSLPDGRPAIHPAAFPTLAQVASVLPSAQTIGDASRTAFPIMNSIRDNTVASVNDYLAKGQVARAVGAGFAGPIKLAAGGLAELATKPVAALASGARELLGGVIGSNGSETDANKTPVPAIAAPAAQPAVTQALAQGRAAAPAMTPQDALSSYITNVLSHGATIREAQALGGLVPALAKQTQTAKDSVVGQTAALSQAIFQRQVDELQKQVAAGKVTDEEAGKLADQYAMQHFQRQASVVSSFNPASFAQANLLDQAGAQ